MNGVCWQDTFAIFHQLMSARFVAILLLIFSSVLYADNITLQSPIDYQVVQRRTKSEGVFHLKGPAIAGAEKWQYRLLGKSLNGKADESWKEFTPLEKEGSFDAEIKAPAGGWYRLQVQALKASQIVAAGKVDHLGIGEVFIVAGQSNAGNYGSEKQETKSGKVASFNGTVWALANDPQQGAGGNGGSFIPAFGDAMSERFHVPVGIADCAVGGTSVRQWLPKGDKVKNQPTTGGMKQVGEGEWESSGTLFDKLGRLFTALGPQGYRAVLWHQGESDAGQARAGYPADRQITGDQYFEFMSRLIRASKNKATWPVPWFTAQTTYHSEADASDEEFRAAMKKLWEQGLSWEGADTDSLKAEYRAGVHLNGKGLQKHGQMWAEKVGPWLEDRLAAPHDGPPSQDYKLVWQDEFDGTAMDETKWGHRSVGPRRGAFIDPACVTLDGKGHLLITVKKVGEEYHGGMIGTEHKQSWKYGYFECRVQVAVQPGMNTAFWMQAPRMGDPDRGKAIADDTAHNGTELDILEYIARQGEVAHFNLHWNGYGKLHKSSPSDGWIPELRKGFHTYGMEWRPDGYRFFVDGHLMWQTNEAISQTEEYIILDLEVSEWAGGIKTAELPASAVFDWVRVWQKP